MHGETVKIESMSIFRFLNPCNPTHSLTLSFTERYFTITLLRTQRDTNLSVAFRYSDQKIAIYFFLHLRPSDYACDSSLMEVPKTKVQTPSFKATFCINISVKY